MKHILHLYFSRVSNMFQIYLNLWNMLLPTFNTMIWQNFSYSLQVNIQNKKVYNCNKTDKFLLISAPMSK